MDQRGIDQRRRHVEQGPRASMNTDVKPGDLFIAYSIDRAVRLWTLEGKVLNVEHNNVLILITIEIPGWPESPRGAFLMQSGRIAWVYMHTFNVTELSNRGINKA